MTKSKQSNPVTATSAKPQIKRTKQSCTPKKDKRTPAPINYTCIYHKNKNGMGGIAVDKNSKTIFNIGANNELFALDGDEVVVIANKASNLSTAKKDIRQKDESYLNGSIEKIIKHNITHLNGFVQKYKDKFLLKVSDSKFGNYLVILKSHHNKIDREQLYNTVIVDYPNANNPYFTVELVNTIASHDDDETFIRDLLLEAHIPVEFSLACINQAELVEDVVSENELVERTDLRHLTFVTIDGEDAKDFDDAVYVEIKNDIFHLYVAIADVANYVIPNSALDHDAYLRGTSIYFPKQVIPMLPERLSNGICSLKPNVDRLVMCCQMQITLEGKILEYKIYNAIINSKARLTYSKVQEWLNELSLAPSDLVSNISNLYMVFQALLKSRTHRGAIDFDSVEPIFIFDNNGIISNLEPRERLEAHKLIEECMLAANVCVADFLIVHAHPGLFRIHPKPSEEKFITLKNYLNSIAVPFDVKYSHLAPHHYATLLSNVRDNPNFQTIQQAVLRSMQLAIYSPNNIGHFGLSYDKYLHFTSPIRRYPDLLVHRAAKNIIRNGSYNYVRDLDAMGEQTSFTERRAEELSRKVDAFYKCQYAKTHIGKVFDGVIASIVNFGVFVHISDLMLDGLLHVTNLEQDYFIFDEIRQILLGKKTGITYHVGQKLTIEIAGVDMARLFIDFKLASQEKIVDIFA